MESFRLIFESLLFINYTPKPPVCFVRESDAWEIQAAILKFTSTEGTDQPIIPAFQIHVADWLHCRWNRSERFMEKSFFKCVRLSIA